MTKPKNQEYSDAEIIELIRTDEASLTKAMEYIYLREDLQKIAFYAYRNYKRKLRLLNWQDIFFESILRLVASLLFNRFRGQSELKNYFSRICRNYCNELVRGEDKEMKKQEDWIINPERMVVTKEMESLLKEVLLQQSEQCQRIFELQFYYSKAWAMEDVAKEMGLGGTRSAITTFYRCKKKLIEFIQDHPNLTNLLNFYL